MKFIAIRPIYGDHGLANPGDTFDVPQHLEREYMEHEANGMVRRHRERPAGKAYTVYANKAVIPEANKAK